MVGACSFSLKLSTAGHQGVSGCSAVKPVATEMGQVTWVVNQGLAWQQLPVDTPQQGTGDSSSWASSLHMLFLTALERFSAVSSQAGSPLGLLCGQVWALL